MRSGTQKALRQAQGERIEPQYVNTRRDSRHDATVRRNSPMNWATTGIARGTCSDPGLERMLQATLKELIFSLGGRNSGG